MRFATAAVAALVLLQVLWECWLAPLRPGGSWLALKAVPLALAWLGLVRGKVRARQLTALLLLLYFAEGLVRGVSESGRHAAVAAMAALLAVVAFCALFLAHRREREAAAGSNES
ncbi:MAG: DUF2069 domain-containing protein [Betaproteobacteria bacterium]